MYTKKFELAIGNIGKYELKNLESPLEVYRIVPPWEYKQKEGLALNLPEADQRRIAVLPLVNMKSDPKDEFFSDGLAEKLISTISQVKELRVISRTSVMWCKKAAKGLSEIGRELNGGPP